MIRYEGKSDEKRQLTVGWYAVHKTWYSPQKRGIGTSPFTGGMGDTLVKPESGGERFRLALVPVDEAMWASEQKWGVGRLERLVSPATLAAYRRGWDLYRAALEASDWAAVEAVGPRMVQALAIMDREATEAGNKPLAPDTWEHRPGQTA